MSDCLTACIQCGDMIPHPAIEKMVPMSEQLYKPYVIATAPTSRDVTYHYIIWDPKTGYVVASCVFYTNLRSSIDRLEKAIGECEKA